MEQERIPYSTSLHLDKLKEVAVFMAAGISQMFSLNIETLTDII
jgi:hypothetical protein